jgi:hypothetical protein
VCEFYYNSLWNLSSSNSLSKIIQIKIDRSIILSVVLYGCGSWSRKLREERRLRVFENMVMRRIFGPQRDLVTGEWRKLNNDNRNDLYCSLSIVRVITLRSIRWTGHVARMGRGDVFAGFC